MKDTLLKVVLILTLCMNTGLVYAEASINVSAMYCQITSGDEVLIQLLKLKKNNRVLKVYISDAIRQWGKTLEITNKGDELKERLAYLINNWGEPVYPILLT